VKKLTFRFIIIFLIAFSLPGTIFCMEIEKQKELEKIMHKYKKEKEIPEDVKYKEFHGLLEKLTSKIEQMANSSLKFKILQKKYAKLKKYNKDLKQNSQGIDSLLKNFRFIADNQLQKNKDKKDEAYKICIKKELKNKLYLEQEKEHEKQVKAKIATINADNIKKLLQMRRELIRKKIYITATLVCTMFFLYFFVL